MELNKIQWIRKWKWQFLQNVEEVDISLFQVYTEPDP